MLERGGDVMARFVPNVSKWTPYPINTESIEAFARNLDWVAVFQINCQSDFKLQCDDATLFHVSLYLGFFVTTGVEQLLNESSVL